MNASHPTIDPDRLRRLLAGELSAEEQAEVLARLEQSPADRQSLEQLAATPELWEKASAFLGDLPSRSHPEPGRHDDDSPTPRLGFLRPSSHAECIGELGHYRVLERIGSGGMGIVLKAVDPVLNRVVAMKVLLPALAEQPLARKRFLREARAAAAVSHEHVVRIYAVEEDQGMPYLVMEFISGITLQQRIEKDAPLELRETLRIGMQIAAGLAAAHRQGLVHRDIKPANVLLENGIQRVKITDFGLARSDEVPSLTVSGTISGTPEYMAPEQTRDGNVDFRADLFSLGSVLYAMCTGKSPFRKSSIVATIREVAEQHPRPITELNPEIPGWLVQLIERLHAKRAEDRPQSAAEVERRLAAGLSQLQHPAPELPTAWTETQEGRVQPRRQSRLTTAALALGVLALITAIAALAWSVRRHGPDIRQSSPHVVPFQPPQDAPRSSSPPLGNAPRAGRNAPDWSRPITLKRPYEPSSSGSPTDRASVQDAVMAICREVGIAYQFNKSQQEAGEVCRQWVYPEFQNVPAQQALHELLTPLGTTYSTDEQGLYLKRLKARATNPD